MKGSSNSISDSTSSPESSPEDSNKPTRKGFKVRVPAMGKVLIIVCAVLAVLSVGYSVYSYYSKSWSNPEKVRITNVGSRSATVTWATKERTEGYVIYSESDKFGPWMFSKIGKTYAYDDRDVVQARLDAAAKESENLEDEGTEVNYTDVDEEIVVERVGEYYVHHVTITDLEPETKYFFMVGNGRRFVSVDVDEDDGGDGDNSVKTFAESEDLPLPNPAYGLVRKEVEEEEFVDMSDAIVYLTAEIPTEYKTSTLMSAVTGDNGSWYIDLSIARDSESGEIFSGFTEKDGEFISVEAGPNGYVEEFGNPARTDTPANQIVIWEDDDGWSDEESSSNGSDSTGLVSFLNNLATPVFADCVSECLPNCKDGGPAQCPGGSPGPGSCECSACTSWREGCQKGCEEKCKSVSSGGDDGDDDCKWELKTKPDVGEEFCKVEASDGRCCWACFRNAYQNTCSGKWKREGEFNCYRSDSEGACAGNDTPPGENGKPASTGQEPTGGGGGGGGGGSEPCGTKVDAGKKICPGDSCAIGQYCGDENKSSCKCGAGSVACGKECTKSQYYSACCYNNQTEKGSSICQNLVENDGASIGACDGGGATGGACAGSVRPDDVAVADRCGTDNDCNSGQWCGDKDDYPCKCGAGSVACGHQCTDDTYYRKCCSSGSTIEDSGTCKNLVKNGSATLGACSGDSGEKICCGKLDEDLSGSVSCPGGSSCTAAVYTRKWVSASVGCGSGWSQVKDSYGCTSTYSSGESHYISCASTCPLSGEKIHLSTDISLCCGSGGDKCCVKGGSSSEGTCKNGKNYKIQHIDTKTSSASCSGSGYVESVMSVCDNTISASSTTGSGYRCWVAGNNYGTVSSAEECCGKEGSSVAPTYGASCVGSKTSITGGYVCNSGNIGNCAPGDAGHIRCVAADPDSGVPGSGDQCWWTYDADCPDKVGVAVEPVGTCYSGREYTFYDGSGEEITDKHISYESQITEAQCGNEAYLSGSLDAAAQEYMETTKLTMFNPCQEGRESCSYKAVSGSFSSRWHEGDDSSIQNPPQLFGMNSNSRVIERTLAVDSSIVYDPLTRIYSSDGGGFIIEYNGEKYYFSVRDDPGNYYLYIDNNENGIYDEGVDTLIESDPQELNVEKVESIDTYGIEEGFNLVSFPLVLNVFGDSGVMASDLLDFLNSEYGDAFYSIAQYNSGWEIVGNRDGQTYGESNDFMISPGIGYVLRSKWDLEIDIYGNDILDPVPVYYREGWNLAAVHGTDEAYTAGSLIDSIDDVEGLDADNVTEWNLETYRYEGVQKEEDDAGEMHVYGHDFPIVDRLGYFVRIASGSGTWIPD